MKKRVDKISSSLFWLLGVLLVFAIASGWNVVLRILVIVVAIALLSVDIVQIVTRR